MLPRVGSRSPVSSRNRVVFPVPLRPTRPQRSPGATVKETSENSLVAPKSTPTPAKAIWTIWYSSIGLGPLHRSAYRKEFRHDRPIGSHAVAQPRGGVFSPRAGDAGAGCGGVDRCDSGARSGADAGVRGRRAAKIRVSQGIAERR